MKVRKITKEDISRFENIGVSNGSKPLNLKRWIEDGRTRLEWCFLVESKGSILGRIIYGIIEEQPEELKIWQLKLDTHILRTNEELLVAGESIIKDSLRELKDYNFKSVEYHMYTSNYEHAVVDLSIKDNSYLTSFTRNDFKIIQEKKNYELEQEQFAPLDTEELHFKTLEEVGENVFVEAIEIVTQGTLDRDDINSMKLYGSKKAAVLYYELLKDIDYNPTWWKLAYDSTNQLVGLIVPQQFDETYGAINYIGVNPIKRGKNYSMQLLNNGINSLLRSGRKLIIADIDVLNRPLENALCKLGFQYKNSLLVLSLNLNSNNK